MGFLGCGAINSFAIHLRARTLGPPEVLKIRNSQITDVIRVIRWVLIKCESRYCNSRINV